MLANYTTLYRSKSFSFTTNIFNYLMRGIFPNFYLYKFTPNFSICIHFPYAGILNNRFIQEKYSLNGNCLF